MTDDATRDHSRSSLELLSGPLVITGWFDIHGTWIEYDEPLVVE